MTWRGLAKRPSSEDTTGALEPYPGAAISAAITPEHSLEA